MSDQLDESAEAKRFDGELKPIVEVGESSSRPQKILDRMAHYQTPAVSIVLIQNFKVIQTLNYGQISAGDRTEVTDNTLFGSVRKSVSKQLRQSDEQKDMGYASTNGNYKS